MKGPPDLSNNVGRSDREATRAKDMADKESGSETESDYDWGSSIPSPGLMSNPTSSAEDDVTLVEETAILFRTLRYLTVM